MLRLQFDVESQLFGIISRERFVFRCYFKDFREMADKSLDRLLAPSRDPIRKVGLNFPSPQTKKPSTPSAQQRSESPLKRSIPETVQSKINVPVPSEIKKPVEVPTEPQVDPGLEHLPEALQRFWQVEDF